MCLAVPARIVEQDGSEATVDLHGNRLTVSTVLVPEAKRGDWVLLHAGFAIQLVSDEAARKTWSILEDMQTKAGAA
jgi:hydrogenase expression/formation protein HypC